MGVRLWFVSLRPRALAAAAALAVVSLPAAPVHAATTGAVQTYIVTYHDGASSSGAAAVIQGAGGELVYNYQEIGVVIARSNRSDFAANLRSAAGVDGAVATAPFATRLDESRLDSSAADSSVNATPLSGDNLSGLQWDMTQIKAFDAQSVTSGSRNVIAGDIDTGVDFTHPDLAPNVDFANSVSCLGGVPDQTPAAWKDDNGHGTHTAGTIAAARNGIGIVGVAPNVRLAAIKAGTTDGFFFPESVVCAFMWAGTHHFNVTNNSYFADPFYFNCKNDPTQRAIWKAEARAIRFAMQQGVTVVAAEGNFADDLAHPTQDTQSPDDTKPVTRPVGNDCVVIPTEIPGVIGVTADGNLQQKSFYSNYGVGVTQVTAPGGDSVLQRTAAAVNGRVRHSQVLLPAGHFDGLAARHRRGRADRKPRHHQPGPGGGPNQQHRRRDGVPERRGTGRVRVLPVRQQRRGASVRRRTGIQLLVRARPGRCAERCELTERRLEAVDKGALSVQDHEPGGLEVEPGRPVDFGKAHLLA